MKRLALVLATAACGSSGGAKPDARIVVPDAAPDAYVPGPNQVTLTVYGATPKLIAYRDGKGPWLVPDALTAGKYTLNVTDAYQVLVACVATRADVRVTDATYGDGTKKFAFCDDGATTPPTTVPITGSMQQAGSVDFYVHTGSQTAPWTFDIDVPPGMHDLIAISTDHRMLIRRDQNVTAAATLPVIDTAAAGTPMTQLDLTLNGLQTGDHIMTGMDLFTRDFASWTETSTTIYAPPASLLTPDDFVDIFAEAYSPTSFRAGYGTFTGTQTTFDLPAPLTGVTFGTTSSALSATWTSLPAYTALGLISDDGNATFAIDASKSYVTATHATALALDALPPGLDTSWLPKLAGMHTSMFSATDDTGPITYQTGAFQSANVNSVVRVAESFRTRLRSLHRSTDR